MKRSKALWGAGAALLSAVLAVVLLQSPTPEATIAAQQSPTQTPDAIPTDLPDSKVLTWNCELEDQKPELIMITCADGGLYVEKIKWNTWSRDGATGRGILSENLCVPSCSEGKRVRALVNLGLSNLTEQNGKYYLRTLDMRTVDGENFPWRKTNGFEWDVMEFAEMMESND